MGQERLLRWPEYRRKTKKEAHERRFSAACAIVVLLLFSSLLATLPPPLARSPEAMTAEADDPTAAETLEKFRLYETRAVSPLTLSLPLYLSLSKMRMRRRRNHLIDWGWGEPWICRGST